jgi:hypothetical protein
MLNVFTSMDFQSVVCDCFLTFMQGFYFSFLAIKMASCEKQYYVTNNKCVN